VIESCPALSPDKQKSGDFIWAAGIEDTFVPQTRPGHNSLDEYLLMGHYDHWREDLDLCREIGVNALSGASRGTRSNPKRANSIGNGPTR
jgi:hypothetical protein